MEALIEGEDPSLRLHGSMMGWQSGVLVVNFSEALVRFLREVRQLDELGFEIPRNSTNRSKSIADKALEAERYYRYGILLKKTANFYNGLAEQMIDVQEQLLLASLDAFVTLSKQSGGKSGKEISWNNPSDCENYIRSLEEAAEKLSSENKYLRKVHENLCTLTVSLMGYDLLRQTELWKEKWKILKEKMAAVKSRYSEKDARTWVLHWDHQVYKALEASYQMGLESLNESLPEIKVEMLFVKNRLEFKPPLEEIREKYYKEMRKFLAMPASFEGFNNPLLFRRMGARNSKRLIKVYSKAEMLFDKLAQLIKKYSSSWTKLAQLDLDQFVDANVKTPDEFIVNFKMLNVKRKDIDKFPDIEKVACCTVSLTPFKIYLDSLLLRLSDVLLVSLRRSVLKDFKEVDVFLDTSIEKLNSKPHTVEEISQANKMWKEIDGQKDAMKVLSRSCVERKKLLLDYAPGSAIDVSEVIQKMSNLDGEGGRWDNFDISLEAFDDIVTQQKEALKGTLQEEVISLESNIEKFRARWNQLKPTDVKSWEYSVVQKVFDTLQDWNKEFEGMYGETYETFSLI